MKTWRNIAAVIVTAFVLVARAPAAAQPDRLTPSDAELVLQVNVRQLLHTPLVQKHALDALKKLLQHNGEISQFLQTAGIDPLKDLDTLAVALSDDPSGTGRLRDLAQKLLVVARGRFDPDKAQSAAGDYAKRHPDRLQTIQDGKVSLWKITTKQGDYFAAFADKRTLVMTLSKEETAAAAGRAGQKAQALNKELRAALGRLSGDAPVWMAMTVGDRIKDLLKGDDNAKDFAAVVQAITAALDVHDDACLALDFHAKSPAGAAKIKGKIDELMQLCAFLGAGKDNSGQVAKEVIDSIKLKTEKSDVSIRLRITDAQIEKVRKKDR